MLREIDQLQVKWNQITSKELQKNHKMNCTYLLTESWRPNLWPCEATATRTWCCDWIALGASMQSFTLWQQATIEITCNDYSIVACSRHICVGVVLRTHTVCGESHIQRNAKREVTTTSPPFYNEPHLLVKAAPGTTFTSWSQHHFVAIGKP